MPVSSGVTCAPPKVIGNPQKREVIARETEATAAFTRAKSRGHPPDLPHRLQPLRLLVRGARRCATPAARCAACAIASLLGFYDAFRRIVT
jgi:hypothetical protein